MQMNFQWVEPPVRVGRGRDTVSEYVDCFIFIGEQKDKEYLCVRFYKDKFAQYFSGAEHLTIGFIGDYLGISVSQRGEGYKVYTPGKGAGNPEIRVPIDKILDMERDPEEYCGSYLLKYDKPIKQVYIDKTRKTTP